MEHAEIGASKVGEVAGDQDQSPGPGRGGQEAIDGGEWIGNVRTPNPPRCGRAAVTECDERVEGAVVAPRRTPILCTPNSEPKLSAGWRIGGCLVVKDQVWLPAADHLRRFGDRPAHHRSLWPASGRSIASRAVVSGVG